jgi:hypothetical protein
MEFVHLVVTPARFPRAGRRHASILHSRQNGIRLSFNIIVRPQIELAASLLHVVLVHRSEHWFNVLLKTECHTRFFSLRRRFSALPERFATKKLLKNPCHSHIGTLVMETFNVLQEFASGENPATQRLKFSNW